MKIICMIRSLQLGGAERQLAALAIQLKKMGHNVEVLTYLEGDFYNGMLDTGGVKHTIIQKDRHIISKLEGHFRKEKPDMVIAFMTGPGIKACRVKARFPDFKLVVSERNSNTWTGPHDIWRFLHYRIADCIVVNSHTQTAYIRRHFPFLTPKLRTIVNFVDTSVFSPDANHENATPLIVTAARIDSRKNVHGYIRALERIKKEGYPFQARWYGQTDENNRYYKRCRARASRLGIDDCFQILKASENIASVYRGADIFCLPSFYEGTSNALAEALSCGLPCIVSNVSDNGLYVISQRNGFLFNPHSTASITRALKSILDKAPTELRAMGRESSAIAALNFPPDAFVKAYATLCEDIFADLKI